MAQLHIDEYNAKGESYSAESGRTPDTVYPKLVKTQNQITTSNASQPSAVFDDKTAFVSIRAVGGAVYVKIGKNPTALNTTTGGSKYLADGDVWDVDVNEGERVAVIDA
jgi:hypothetical protein